MLKGQCISSYTKVGKDGKARKIFVFKVTGPDEQKEEYLKLQRKRFEKGQFTDEDGNPLYFTSSPAGASINLVITTKGNIVQDTTAMDLQASTQARYDHVYQGVRKSLEFTGNPIVQEPTKKIVGDPDLEE